MMPTSGDLIRIFADVLHIPSEKVAAYYRTLREADLVTRGGRGRSAPKSSVLDASRLLASLLWAENAAYADDAVIQLTDLPPLIDFETQTEPGVGQHPYDMSAFGELNFIAAVEHLFTSFDKVSRRLDRLDYGKEDRLRISVFPTDPAAEIRAGSTVVRYADQNLLSRVDKPGITVRREVGEGAIALIADCLRPK
ncbi:hypothetical protein [Asticcacaulis taihuensis]|uniref:hypothetical protein n=1 Tax=Asticcacaulis taihuensis TaxID=260084 RepID=UPI003F7BA9D8